MPTPRVASAATRQSSSRATSGRIHTARKRLGPGVVEQLVANYEAGHSTNALMQRYGLGKGTVLGILAEHDVRMRGQGIPGDRIDKAIALYRGGMSLKRVADQFDCSAETIRQALLDAGVTMRRQWERGSL